MEKYFFRIRICYCSLDRKSIILIKKMANEAGFIDKLTVTKADTKTIRLCGVMRKIGKTSTGNILIEITPEDISEALKKYRRENRLSQVALAKKLGVSRGYIYGLERCITPVNTGLEKYRRIISMIF